MTKEERAKAISYLQISAPVRAMTQEEFDKYIYLINEVIKVLEQEPKWIPVSERLPEDGQNVLFCDIDNDIMLGYHVKGRPCTHFSQDGTYDDMKNVKAWIPLPDPYKEESE